jgi:hypothetical protein
LISVGRIKLESRCKLDRYCTALHCTALHCTALHCTGQPILERSGQARMILWALFRTLYFGHCTALHCTALHCTGKIYLGQFRLYNDYITALHCTGLQVGRAVLGGRGVGPCTQGGDHTQQQRGKCPGIHHRLILQCCKADPKWVNSGISILVWTCTIFGRACMISCMPAFRLKLSFREVYHDHEPMPCIAHYGGHSPLGKFRLEYFGSDFWGSLGWPQPAPLVQ